MCSHHIDAAPQRRGVKPTLLASLMAVLLGLTGCGGGQPAQAPSALADTGARKAALSLQTGGD